MGLDQVLGYFGEDASISNINTTLLFNKVIGVQGIVSGVGVSTVVANLAYTISKRTDLSVCILDTSFITPVHYKQITKLDNDAKDILDFNGDLSVICHKTKIPRVYFTGLVDRSLLDMLSSKDSGEVVNEVIKELKNRFDVILIDLCNEYTNIRVEAAIKCNKIYTVLDTSSRSVLNIAKIINTNATTVVPFYKSRDTIVTKTIPGITDSLVKSFSRYDLNVIGEIPFDLEIYKSSVDGVMFYERVSSGDNVTLFNNILYNMVKRLLPEDSVLNKADCEIEAEESAKWD